ncbi:MAG: GNAT family N-acetyltransferase [Proteobacteria bacterium]|nr:GNAT family N-acetyltransferase [Pseudomonadota bacterium]
MTGITLRDLAGMDEFLAAEDLQRAVWGRDDTADPADLMMVIQSEGGLCGGAFAGGRMVGYVFAFPTREAQVQHSHRLAVLPEMRGAGLGARLKWYQRDWCLARGIGHVRWTFDPLRLTNASLNIGHLGATARVYLPDYYGAMKGINAGAPSDRLVADWDLRCPAVAARATGRPLPAPEAQSAPRVAIPPDFPALLNEDGPRALAERLRVRKALTQAFATDQAITGFDRGAGAYVLGHLPA